MHISNVIVFEVCISYIILEMLVYHGAYDENVLWGFGARKQTSNNLEVSLIHRSHFLE